MADTPLTMSLGAAGLTLIQSFETFQSKLYDTDGGGHCTVGWGHLVHPGLCDGRENEKAFLKGITEEDGNKWLTTDVSTAVTAVNTKVGKLGATLTQNQFDALVSFTYNCGTGALQVVLDACTDKGTLDLTKVPDKMKLYETSNGKILLGLTRRRAKEVELYNKKD